MSTEKIVTQETKTEVKNPLPVKEIKTTTKRTETKVEPKPRVIEETTIIEEED